MPRAINRVRARLHHVAHNHVIEFTGVNARTPNRLLRSVHRQINRAQIGKRARIAHHRRSGSRHKHHIGWEHFVSPEISWKFHHSKTAFTRQFFAQNIQ
jgi:hypothetical protein